jgi:hypothetical protein
MGAQLDNYVLHFMLVRMKILTKDFTQCIATSQQIPGPLKENKFPVGHPKFLK